MLDCELCHFISKLINNDKNTFKSFMTFDIMFCGPIFRAIVGGEIVPPTQGKQKEEDFKGRKKIGRAHV